MRCLAQVRPTVPLLQRAVPGRSLPRYGSIATRKLASASTSAQPRLSQLRVQQDRLMETIHYTSRWGTGARWGERPTDTGMSRLTLSDADKEARDWFVDTTRSLGCHITVDAIGNIFAVRPGKKEGPATFVGSHLDTQPTGGRYDGVLGVQAGIEMLRVLHENEIQTEYAVGVVNWTNEEGARFPVSMMGSGVWSGFFPLEDAYNLRSVIGNQATLREELERIGYLGQTPASYESMPMAAHFELHIEQGPALEAERRKIGVVQGVQAYNWFTVEIQGKDSHTGTTPLANRSDALLLASKFILHSHRIATKHSALVTTGILTALPGSTNTIPGLVRFTLDVRSPKNETVEAVAADLKRDFATLASGQDVGDLHAGGTAGRNEFKVSWTTDSATSATVFHEDCIRCVREATSDVFGDRTKELVRDISSGAGHDSVYASRRCPTTMIFIPCRDGVSHNPAEYSTPEDCALGTQVVLNSVLRYDKLRKAADA
ncbi:hypothetical protein JX265_013248 [Neoarthrinium moseri]|uniref:Peptidase M20 dimerisation domain-containing protein n=1 Tax=Neoarthrinium moseri TaxID=1658444 RepID=A0A9P9W8R2_9PEZI|nr:hypothetical protein JX266_013252 [Neoarthrinium moseri]KAI1851501.1 hypothetical protein JX265_013248 [Neoarthrinium moseri]